MIPNPDLAIWETICRAPVIGPVGHHRTQEPGPAHPAGLAPAWVTAHGCDLALLHAAHTAHVVHDGHGEDRECEVGPVRQMRAAKREKVTTMRKTA